MTVFNAAGMTPLFWWRDAPNFGDALAPWLMKRVLGAPVRWSSAAGKMLGVGSVLYAAEAGDVVWGTGVHPFSERWRPDWSPAGVTFLAVRGPLTRDYILARGGDCPACYGDPGELLPLYYAPAASAPTAKLGVVPHLHDETGRRIGGGCQDAIVIDVRDPWRSVVDKIAACELIWSSSLHGVIIAEAYGVPAVWIQCGEGALKYRDYYGATERFEVEPVDWLDAAGAAPPQLPRRRSLERHPLLQAMRRNARRPR